MCGANSQPARGRVWIGFVGCIHDESVFDGGSVRHRSEVAVLEVSRSRSDKMSLLNASRGAEETEQ